MWNSPVAIEGGTGCGQGRGNSSQSLQTLIAADLVDEHRLWVFPVVLGKGKRLFENGVPPRSLTLSATRSTSSGVLLNTYSGLITIAEDICNALRLRSPCPARQPERAKVPIRR